MRGDSGHVSLGLATGCGVRIEAGPPPPLLAGGGGGGSAAAGGGAGEESAAVSPAVSAGDGADAGNGLVAADFERSNASRLYVSENLTRKRQDIFQALLNEKRQKRLYTVFTKHGEVFCKTMQHGRKIRVDSLDAIPDALRG